MRIYYDLDGVLSDIDGTLAAYIGVESWQIVLDRTLRTDTYLLRMRELGHISESFSTLLTNRLPEMKSLMREMHARGHTQEILSSYGIQKEFFQIDPLQAGAHIHEGKARWLITHYGDLFQQGILSRFNGVTNCDQKAFYSKEGTLLIDDTLSNVEQFRSGEGQAIHYELWRHDECLHQILEATKCVE